MTQVAEPLIAPSFAAASVMEYTESPVFDIKDGMHQGVSQPRGITQAVAHPGYDAGIKENGTITGTGSSLFEVKPAGHQVISGHEQPGFDLIPGAMAEKVGFGRNMTDVSQQLPEDIHAEHAQNGEKTIYHPQSNSMIPEIPIENENSPESGRTEIMAAEKKSVYQPERNLNITGTPEDEVPGDSKKAIKENTKSLKDTPRVFQVQPERISHELQTDSADPGHLRKPGDKYQTIETINQSEFQIAASHELSAMINLMDSAEREPAKPGYVYHHAIKPGTMLQHEISLPDRKIYQTDRTGESYISNQKRREIQDSLTLATIAGTPDPRRKLYQNSSAVANRNPPEKHIEESHSTNPAIRVTIGRVEVRAATKPAQVSVPSRQNPALSLNDYLKKRNGNTL